MSDRSPDKEVEHLNIDKPKQMSLFEIIEAPEGIKNNYSNTIELYDALPKYVWDQKKYTDLANAVVTRECIMRSETVKLKIRPALIESDEGTLLIYPGTREEIVEDALRKLAVNGHGRAIDGEAGVLFTLYKLQRELSAMGHGFNLAEIKESIQVCRGAGLDVITDNGETVISANFFQMVGLTTKGEFKKKGGDAKCYVQFNPLVNKSIMTMNFRQYNYQIGMKIKSPLARFIYKRMCHYWTQASGSNPYTPSLISFLTQSPRPFSERMSENIRAMKNALEILKKLDVISTYEEDREKDGKRTVNVHYRIFPTETFKKEHIRANVRKRNIEQRAQISMLKDSIDHDIADEHIPDE